MEQKTPATEKTAIIGIALLANALFFGVLFALAWYEVDYEKWLGLLIWTGFPFGVLFYACAHDLKKWRSRLVFTVLLAIHVLVCVFYLRSAHRFPNLLFLFVAPFEVGFAAVVMTFVGGVRPRLLRHRKYRPGGKLG